MESDLIPAQLVATGAGAAPAGAVLPTSMADALGLEVVTTNLRLSGDLDRATETRISESVRGTVQDTYLYVERGYERPPYASARAPR